MVEKKLNFNRPILSVRRNPPSHIADQRKTSNALPVTRPWIHPQEPRSGPIKNPGSVPFVWEQSPGLPKEEILAQCRDLETLPRTTRFLDESSRDTSEQSWSSDSEVCSNEAVVEQRQERRRKAMTQERPVQLHCRPSFDNCVLYYKEKQERDVSDEHEQNVITVCCLLPRSCLKATVCNLNPVPAMSVMNRVMAFPANRIIPATVLSGSSTDCENEHKEEASSEKSFRTLQELLSAEGGLKETVKKVEDDGEKSGEMNMEEDSDQDSSSEEDAIRVAVSKAAIQNAKEKLSRAKTLGNGGVAPPPLPESPSDSWLFRTVSTKKALSSASISRLSNKQY